MIQKPASRLTILLKDGTTLKFIAVSTMIEDGFLKVIDNDCILHAFNTDEVHSYKLSIDLPPTH